MVKAPKRRVSRLILRLMLLVGVVVLVLGTVIVALAAYMLRQEAKVTAQERIETNMKVAWETLRQKGTTFRLQNGQLFLGDHLLNNDTEIVDTVTRVVGGTCTIFAADVRISTNVMKADGVQVIGTPLAPGPVYETIFTNKRPFRGEADVLGVATMAGYDPILDASGTVIGVLYVGMKMDDFLSAADETLKRILLTTGIVLLLVSVLFYLLARRSLARKQEEEEQHEEERWAGRKDEISLANALERERLEVYISSTARALSAENIFTPAARPVSALQEGPLVSSAAAEQLSMQSDNLSREVEHFHDVIKVGGDRRQFERHDCHLPATVQAGEQKETTVVVNISASGARLTSPSSLSPGESVELTIEGWSTIKARIVSSDGGVTRLQFLILRYSDWRAWMDRNQKVV